ncbi:MAG TPA: substrate-binding domain-containing protein [Xanthomonadales bacterium]|nr:substrate-binding domain-containing protein [Xanthomonadales bacterium]
MHTWTRCAVAAVAFALSLPLAAQPTKPVWNGDLASGRAYLVDAAKLYELKRNTSITVKAINTISALEAVARGQAEVVGSARGPDPKTPLEQDLVFTPIAYDELVLIVHPGNPIRNIALTQLRDVYAGRIKSWAALGGPDKPINLYTVAGPNDGVEYSLRRLIFGNGAAIVGGRWYINTKQLEEAVAIDPSGFGVTTLSNVFANKAVRMLTVDNVAPARATLEDASYPLITPLYLVARKETPGQSSSVSLGKKALEFFLGEPAFSKALRDKQLVPASDAKKLADSQAAREARVMAMLGVSPAALPKPPGPPMPPAPKKNKELNNVRLAADTIRAQREEKADMGGASDKRNALANGAEPAKSSYCRPKPMCMPKAPVAAKPTAP